MNVQTAAGPLWKGKCLADFLHPDLNSFGVIRLGMAIAVLVSHSYFFVSGSSATEPLVGLTGHSLGEHGVQVFFLLSGIVVSESLLRNPSIVSFVCGRIMRVFPGLIVCVALLTLVLGPVVTHLSVRDYFADPLWIKYVVKTVLLVTGSAELPGVFTNLPTAGLVDMSLWTLKYEMICYIGIGGLGSLGLMSERLRPYFAAGLAIVLCFAFLKPADPAHANSFGEHVRYFGLYFGVGTLAALLKHDIPIKRWAPFPLLALFVATIGTPLQELTCAVFLGYSTLVLATMEFGGLRGWCNRYDISYGVYIYAAPIQQALLQANPGIHPLTLSIVSLAIAAAVATLSWSFVEKPAMAQRQNVAARLERTMGWLREAITGNGRGHLQTSRV